MGKEARIIKSCSCANYGVVETGTGECSNIIQLWGTDGRIRYSNREPDEEMDDLEMVCIRCGASARWE